MYEDDRAHARAQLQTCEDRSGEDILLGYVTQSERLCAMVEQALKRVSDDLSSLAAFLDALVQLGRSVDSAREFRTIPSGQCGRFSKICHGSSMICFGLSQPSLAGPGPVRVRSTRRALTPRNPHLLPSDDFRRSRATRGVPVGCRDLYHGVAPHPQLTEEELAQRLGWHCRRVAAIESGRRVDVPELFALTDGLRIDPVLLVLRIRTWVTMPTVASCYRAMEDAEPLMKAGNAAMQCSPNDSLGWLKELRSSSNPLVSFARMATPAKAAADWTLPISTV